MQSLREPLPPSPVSERPSRADSSLVRGARAARVSRSVHVIKGHQSARASARPSLSPARSRPPPPPPPRARTTPAAWAPPTRPGARSWPSWSGAGRALAGASKGRPATEQGCHRCRPPARARRVDRRARTDARLRRVRSRRGPRLLRGVLRPRVGRRRPGRRHRLGQVDADGVAGRGEWSCGGYGRVRHPARRPRR